MTTARDIVERSLRIMKVVPLGQSPGSGATSEALLLLNGMLAAWSEKGLTGYTHAALTLASTMATNAALDLYLPYMLAFVAAKDFDAQLGDGDAAMAMEGDALARKIYGPFHTDTLTVDSALKRMPGLGAGYLQW